MKERIKNIVIILLVFGGLVLCAALIDYYLPEWVYYTFLGLVLAWIVWDSSKTEKKKGKHYWHYTFVKGDKDTLTFGAGTMITDDEEFDFVEYNKKFQSCCILNVTEISESQYKEFNETISRND